MSDATTSAVSNPALSPLAPSRSVNGSSLLGKRRTRHEQSSAKSTVGTSTTANISTGDILSPLVSPTTHTSTSDTLPSKRPKPTLSLNHPIDNTMPEPSSSSSSSTHCPEPASPAATEIAYDISHVEPLPEDHMEALRAAGIKVRDFAYEPTPNSSKAPEVFDPVPSLIAADWHMRNPEKNYGLLSPKGLFRLIKMGWLSVADVRLNLHPREYAALAQYNDRPDEQRYPFVVVPPGQPIPTPSQRVRLRRQAGLCSHPDDVPDSEFFGYDPTGFSDDEGEEGEGGPSSRPHRHLPTPSTPMETSASASALSGVAVEEAEVLVEEPKPKRRKVKGTAKARGRAKPKPLRRECSRPEV
jgi:hypothetical protein